MAKVAEAMGRALAVALGCTLSVAAADRPVAVAHWDFDGQIKGTFVNGPTRVPGVTGQGLSFAGEDDRLEVPHSREIDLGAAEEDYSISFWFLANRLPVDPPDAHFITKFGDPYPFSFVQIANGMVQFRTYDSTTCSIVDSTIDLSDGRWHFVVGLRDGHRRRLSLFVDGMLVSAAPDESRGDLRNAGPLYIGRSHGDDFKGTLDEIRIYRGLLSRKDILDQYRGTTVPPQPSHRDRGPAARRAPGVPAMRRRMAAWQPRLSRDGSGAVLNEEKRFVLRNAGLEVVIRKDTAEILSFSRGTDGLLSRPGGVAIRDQQAGIEFDSTQGEVVEARPRDSGPMNASVSFQKTYGKDYRAAITYTLSGDSLCCEVTLTTTGTEAREGCITFTLPALKGMTKALWPRHGAPFDLDETFLERVLYRQWDFRTAMVLPFVVVYDSPRDVGLSLVAPFDLPKPGLSFTLDGAAGDVTVSNASLRFAKGEPTRAAVYLIPHEGCWRPSLAWMLKTYPEYFRPGTEDGIETPGWYWLGGPLEGEEPLRKVQEAGGRWFQIHGHFPFYGLYMPEAKTWEVIVGLADQGKADLAKWERGEAQGGYANSYDQMRAAIDLRQKHGLQAFLYLQSFELWKPYAAKHFPDDVATAKNGTPLGAWYHCALMNPDPAFKWGQSIAAQARRVPAEYPALDGIFYDRDDYRDYDYAHDDGVTMMDDVPCYMLGFAQEQINEIVTAVLQEHKMGIWTNGPTSVEVCKGIDGIMSEAVPQAHCHQYLGLVRPMVLLPYFPETKSYDTRPQDTEEKLKVALVSGFFPSLTYGAADCRKLDETYRPLFQKMKGRTWVLYPHALELPPGLTGNLFLSAAGEYLATVVDMARSQMVPADTPLRDVPVTIRVPDAATVKESYILSPDYPGRVPAPLCRDGTSIRVTIPSHRSSSMVVFAR